MAVSFKNEKDIHTCSREKREKWLRLFRQVSRGYSFQKWSDERKKRSISLLEFIRWLCDDIAYFLIWNVNLVLQLRAYGSVIKRNYGLTFFQQWIRMAYLVFIIRTDSKKLRTNHLFDPERWKRVDEFAFNRQNIVHNNILGFPHHEELEICVNKLKFWQFCSSGGWHTPEVLAVYEKGTIMYPSTGVFHVPKTDLFVKEVCGGMGRGAKKFCYDNGIYLDRAGNKFSGRDICLFLSDYSTNKSAILIQKVLKNHDSWKGFTNGSLATCRIVIGRSPSVANEVIPLLATLRMPVGTGETDNYSAGGIAASVDIQTGIMSSGISGKPVNGSFTFDAHPDSGRQITGEMVPYWNKLLAFIQSFHLEFNILSVGWDVAFTEEGLSIIEANPTWGSDVLEAPANKPIIETGYTEWFDGWTGRMKGQEVVPYPQIKKI